MSIEIYDNDGSFWNLLFAEGQLGELSVTSSCPPAIGNFAVVYLSSLFPAIWLSIVDIYYLPDNMIIVLYLLCHDKKKTLEGVLRSLKSPS
jgi:hypothetical protein